MRPKTLIAVPKGGAEINVYEGSKVLFSIGLDAGLHQMSKYRDHIGHKYELTDGAVEILATTCRVKTAEHKVRNQTSANPNYKPPKAAEIMLKQQEREIKKLIAKDKQTDKLIAQANAVIKSEADRKAAEKQAEKDLLEQEAAEEAAQKKPALEADKLKTQTQAE